MIDIEDIANHSIGRFIGHYGQHPIETAAGHKTAEENRQQPDMDDISAQAIPNAAFDEERGATLLFRDPDFEIRFFCGRRTPLDQLLTREMRQFELLFE